MKKMSRIIFFIVSCILLVSCQKNEPPIVADEYYVKYEIATNSMYKVSKVRVELMTEKGYELKFVTKDWEGVFGPFKEGATVKMKVDCVETQDYVISNTDFHGRISVCKNNTPFVLKAEKQSNGSPLIMVYKLGS
ncbi:MAG: hypothetical protein IKM35_00010 [Bacteroidaceae bacterium]|nr:hypothetical protein [Bacteroidaceae bacterium]